MMERQRIAQYLGQIESELADISDILSNSDNDILTSPHLLKSCKYSLIVIAEAIGGVLQHILAKRFKLPITDYSETLGRARERGVFSAELFERLQPFIAFRNMLVHQYWRVEERLFLANIRSGISVFRDFIREIHEFMASAP